MIRNSLECNTLKAQRSLGNNQKQFELAQNMKKLRALTILVKHKPDRQQTWYPVNDFG